MVWPTTLVYTIHSTFLGGSRFVSDKHDLTMTKEIQLQIGELSLTRQPSAISTILGSCVSFTMRHAESGMAAMSHCLLSSRPPGKLTAQGEGRYAYVDSTIEEMMSFFGRAAIQTAELEVKLFGGADVIPVLSGPKSVGHENLQMAKRLMQRYGIGLRASDTGGQTGRRIVFDTESGVVKVQRLRPVR